MRSRFTLPALHPNQGTHNVLIVATENDSLYALDADTGAQLWKMSLLRTGETPSDDRSCCAGDSRRSASPRRR